MPARRRATEQRRRIAARLSLQKNKFARVCSWCSNRADAVNMRSRPSLCVVLDGEYRVVRAGFFDHVNRAAGIMDTVDIETIDDFLGAKGLAVGREFEARDAVADLERTVPASVRGNKHISAL